MIRRLALAAALAVACGGPALAALPPGPAPMAGDTSIAPPNPNERLQQVSAEGGMLTLAAIDTRVRTGDRVEVWVFLAPSNPEPINGVSFIGTWLHIRYMCSQRTVEPFQAAVVGAQMETLFASVPDAPAQPVPANSSSEITYDWACNNKATLTGAPISGLKAAAALAQGH